MVIIYIFCLPQLCFTRINIPGKRAICGVRWLHWFCFRTKCVNWKSALWHLAEFLGSFFFLCYLWDTLIISQFPPAAFENFSIENFALSFAYYPVIGLTGAYTMGFAYLHALQNFFAEILRYGDRVFHEVPT